MQLIFDLLNIGNIFRGRNSILQKWRCHLTELSMGFCLAFRFNLMMLIQMITPDFLLSGEKYLLTIILIMIRIMITTNIF